MYIWMMLAAFIVMLAAFNLSPRSDLRTQQQAPLAEAAITKFLVQHDAAIKYAKYNLEQNHNHPSEHPGISAGAISGCNDSNTGDLCNYLPIGFQYEESLYYSTIYCLNSAVYANTIDPNTGEITKTQIKAEGIENVSNCNDVGHNALYVITYGRVPQRWKNVSTNRILADYYTAMHTKIAVGSSCGIVVPKSVENDERNPLNSDYVIEGIDVQNNSIPPYFLANDAKFIEKCDLEIGGNFPCIIYVTAL